MVTGSAIREICHAAIEAVMPENFIPATVIRKGSRLNIKGKSYDLESYSHIYIISVGKAAVGMVSALDKIIHPYVTEGIILTKQLPQDPPQPGLYRLIQGGHPVPTTGSIAGAEAILTLLEKARKEDLVIFLISGGGSALMTLPVNGIDLETFQAFTNAVLACGASINEFNTLRKHLDSVKGGRLAQRAAPAQQITLILSDVVGSPPEVIASGPTVPDPTTYQDALDILNRYETGSIFPVKILETLELGCAGIIPETLKYDEVDHSRADIFLLAENRTAAYAALSKAQELGLKGSVINTALTGDASSIGALMPSFFSELEEGKVLIFGGETTVRIKGSGLGGRNLEAALASVRRMAERPGCVFVTLATDGEDGPTDAAGAVVTAETLSEAIKAGCDPDSFLRNNDSYHFFEKAGGLIKTGSTGTNVNDLMLLLK